MSVPGFVGKMNECQLVAPLQMDPLGGQSIMALSGSLDYTLGRENVTF